MKMDRFSSKLLAIAALAAGLQAGALNAESFLSTLDSTPNNIWSIGTFEVAQMFTTGNTSKDIGSVSVKIDGVTSQTCNFSVSIYSDNAGSVGSVLGTGLLSGPSVPASFALNTYAASGLTLGANTPYWLVFRNTGSGDVYVADTQGGTTVVTSSAGWTTPNTSAYRFDTSGSFNTWANALPVFSIDSVAPVPEPATLSLAAIGGLLLVFRRRKA